MHPLQKVGMPLIPRTCCYVCSAIPCMHCHVCPITLCVTCDFMYALPVCPAILLSGILSDSICAQFGMPCHSMCAVKLHVCPVMVCSVTSHMPCHDVLCNYMLRCHVCPVILCCWSQLQYKAQLLLLLLLWLSHIAVSLHTNRQGVSRLQIRIQS